ncbi:3-oxoadipate CoA-transferase [Bordetella tumbae]|uniref:3-oxoacid CoA-transferase subunit B n=1 Tax=Bordetella tumbae TaxID=1649139 RepID=UPI0039F0115A
MSQALLPPREQRLSRHHIAQLVAGDIPDGAIVNLGIGMPTLVSNYLPPDREIVLHSENGILGMGAVVEGAQADPDLINASRETISLLPGASISEHTVSFAMMRGGHLDYTVLGGFQVAANGDLANWITDAQDAIPAVGGAMDLAVGARKVYITMDHCTREGMPKLLNRCSYPLTGLKVVDRVYTDMAVVDITPQGMVLYAILDGISTATLQSFTQATLHTPIPPRLIERVSDDRVQYRA